jgi:hypothetical protein
LKSADEISQFRDSKIKMCEVPESKGQ